MWAILCSGVHSGGDGDDEDNDDHRVSENRGKILVSFYD